MKFFQGNIDKKRIIGESIAFFCLLLIYGTAGAGPILNKNIDSISLNIDQRIDLANLEYDDSPYAGRTNIGHIFIPYLSVQVMPLELIVGAWYKHVYVQYSEEEPPEKVYPYMAAVFHTGESSKFTIGNFENLAPFPNTIYNEFLYFEERPVSSGLKLDIQTETFMCKAYINWLKLDTREHPEEFITGLVIDHSPRWPVSWFYYKFYNHYHHKGGQLNKETHPVRIEQDIVVSPVIGLRVWKFYLEGEYYLSIFSQNREPSIYGHAASGTFGFETEIFNISYQCFINEDYYHQDTHLFYLKQDNILHRIRTEYCIYKYKDMLDTMLTINLYGMDPPGIDMRIFVKINLALFEYRNEDANKNKGAGEQPEE